MKGPLVQILVAAALAFFAVLSVHFAGLNLDSVLVLAALPVAVLALFYLMNHTEYLVYFLVGIIPLDTLITMSETAPNISFYKLLFPLCLGAYLFGRATGRFEPVPWNMAEKLCLLFVVFNLMLIPFAPVGDGLAEFLRKLVSMALLYYVITRHSFVPNYRTKLFNAVIFSVLLSVLLGVAMWLIGDNPFSQFKDSELTRITGASGMSPNDYAYVLYLPSALAAAMALRMRTKGLRLFYLLCSAAILFGFTLTFSRSAFVALFLSAMCILVLNLRHVTMKGVMIAFALLLVSTVVVPGKYFERIGSLASFSTDFSPHKDFSLSRRSNYINVGMAIVRDYPLFGAGPGAFKYLHAMPRYQSIPGLYGMPRMPHNIYIQVITGSGIIGLTLMLAYFGAFFIPPLDRHLHHEDLGERALAGAALFALISTAFMGLFLHLMLNKSFWVTLAVARLVSLAPEPESESTDEQEEPV